MPQCILIMDSIMHGFNLYTIDTLRIHDLHSLEPPGTVLHTYMNHGSCYVHNVPAMSIIFMHYYTHYTGPWHASSRHETMSLD